MRLLTPGPAEVPVAIRLQAIGEVLHHSMPEYRQLEAQLREWIADLMGTDGEVVLLPASGTGACEAVTRSLFRPGESVLVVQSGRFGERWADICRVAGLQVHTIDVEWGSRVTQSQVDDALNHHPDVAGICVVHGETSTGALADLAAIASCVGGRAAIVVDAVGTLGLDELQMGAWGVDAAFGAAQKGLLGFPGLSWVAFNGAARNRALRPGVHTLFLDVGRHLEARARGSYVATPAIFQTVALHYSFLCLRQSGWPVVFRRVRALSEAFRQGARALGLHPCCGTTLMNGLTVLTLPDGVAATEVISAARTTTDTLIADGLGRLQGKSLRVMFTAGSDIDAVMAAMTGLEVGLSRSGWPVQQGKALRATLAAWDAYALQTTSNTVAIEVRH